MEKKIITSERINRPTPNGGAYAIAYYQDKSGQPCDKRVAAQVVVLEYDNSDEVVGSTFAYL